MNENNDIKETAMEKVIKQRAKTNFKLLKEPWLENQKNKKERSYS